MNGFFYLRRAAHGRPLASNTHFERSRKRAAQVELVSCLVDILGSGWI